MWCHFHVTRPTIVESTKIGNVQKQWGCQGHKVRLRGTGQVKPYLAHSVLRLYNIIYYFC